MAIEPLTTTPADLALAAQLDAEGRGHATDPAELVAAIRDPAWTWRVDRDAPAICAVRLREAEQEVEVAFLLPRGAPGRVLRPLMLEALRGATTGRAARARAWPVWGEFASALAGGQDKGERAARYWRAVVARGGGELTIREDRRTRPDAPWRTEVPTTGALIGALTAAGAAPADDAPTAE